MDQHRAGGMGAVTIEIQPIRPPRVSVADIRDPLHITAPQRKGCQQDARERTPARRAKMRRVVGRLAPADAELAAYGLLDSRAGLQPPPNDGREASRCQRSDNERRQAARRDKVTLRECQQRRGEQPVESDERKLVYHDAEEKAQRAQWPRVPSWSQRQERPNATTATDQTYPTGTVTFARSASPRSQPSVTPTYPVRAPSTR